MTAKLTILKDRGLVILSYAGHFTMSQGHEALAAYAAHPDAEPGQRHLVDFGKVTSYDAAPVAAIALQANAVDIVQPDTHETLVVLYAPHKIGLELASMVRKSWDGVARVIPVVAQTELEALELLGMAETSFDALMVSN